MSQGFYEEADVRTGKALVHQKNAIRKQDTSKNVVIIPSGVKEHTTNKDKIGHRELPVIESNKIGFKYLKAHGWDFENSDLFPDEYNLKGCRIHEYKGKVYGLSKYSTSMWDGEVSTNIEALEVNPGMRKQGFGLVLMADIIKESINKENSKKITLVVGVRGAEKFYQAIGMESFGDDYFEGDIKWMKVFLESISKKQ